ncbi:hypothetical protein A7K94_0200745 [Modestobacter sp. VKM Ac-2676]|nr:hypothetical protein A7K94_0200745 [Modestobacter sp. VKM Ac-2676]
MRVSIFQDWDANRGNSKGRLVMLSFRLASWVRSSNAPKLIKVPVGVTYRVMIEWILGIELPWKLQLGSGARLFHGTGLVVNDGAIIGANCTLRHSVTIGHRGPGGGCPSIGSNVDIGANVCIIGAVSIGDHVQIGAGSVVVKSVPSGAVVAGNPARIISR